MLDIGRRLKLLRKDVKVLGVFIKAAEITLCVTLVKQPQNKLAV
jgi:hypothetical protein